MIVPDAVIPAVLRIRRANRPFLTAAGARREVDEQALRPASFNPPARIPRGVTISAGREGAVPVYTIAPETSLPAAHLLYAHGGGWVHDISAEHWAFLFQLSAEARLSVTVPIYTLLPYGDAADAYALMLRLYDELAAHGREVLLGGDSAGGQIALSAALGLRNRGVERLRTVLISPALDLTLSNPRIPAVLPTDPWLGVEGTRHLTEQWRGDLPVTDPRVSPLNGDMSGLGAMVLCSGTRDILNPDAHLLRDRARQAGVDVTFVEREGALHVFPLLPTPVGAAARRRIVAALRR